MTTGGCRERGHFPAKITGTISKGPEFRDKARSDTKPSDVWFLIDSDNGKRGWSTIADLVLVEEAAERL